MIDLSGKSMLITGGTGTLGSSLVSMAQDQGAKVWFTYHKNQNGAKRLEKKGACGISCDFSDRRSIETAMEILHKETSSLDVLIHNAAVVCDHTILNMEEADWDYVMQVNLQSVFLITKSCLPLLKPGLHSQKTVGKIFMILSRAAFAGGIGISNYAASKAALAGMVKSLAAELGSENILVNGINPGFMDSAMTRNLPQSVKAHHLQLSATGRYAIPEETAQFILFLCSDVMKNVTGQIFHCDSRQTGQ